VTGLRQHGPMCVRGLVAMACVFAVAAAAVAAPVPARAATTTRLDQRYAIAATLDHAAARLDAVQQVELTNRSAGEIDHVNLAVVPRALGFLASLGPVTVDGAEVATEWTTSINLRVPTRLDRGETARITIPFALQLARAPDAFTARTSAENGVLSFGWWFPILSVEHELYGLGDPRVSFSADAIRLELTSTTELGPDAVACPGLVSATQDSWLCEATDVRDFSFVVNPRFRVTQRDVADIALRVYTETVDGRATADLAERALIGFEEAFGAYPWADLVLAEVGSGGGFSMEYPRMIHLTRDKVADTYVVFHEVAHQWFYAQLGNDQQREPWLDEGLADFATRYLMGIGEDQCSSRPINAEVFAWPAGPTSGGDWTSCDGYFHTVFYKTTEFLNAVRGTMGDDAFFAAMRSWVARNRFGFVTGDRFLGQLQARTDVDLRPTFDAYLADYQVAAPKSSSALRKVS